MYLYICVYIYTYTYDYVTIIKLKEALNLRVREPLEKLEGRDMEENGGWKGKRGSDVIIFEHKKIKSCKGKYQLIYKR